MKSWFNRRKEVEPIIVETEDDLVFLLNNTFVDVDMQDLYCNSEDWFRYMITRNPKAIKILCKLLKIKVKGQ